MHTPIVPIGSIMGNPISKLRQWFSDEVQIPGRGEHKFKIEIVTGIYKGQNIGGRGDVCLRLWHVDDDNKNKLSDIVTITGSYFYKGSSKTVFVNAPFDKIDQIEIWIHRGGKNPNLNWFVDRIITQDVTSKKETPKPETLFPIGRWITMRHQLIATVDSKLPQCDRNQQRRHEDIIINRDWFYFSHFAGGIPTMTDVKLKSESFSFSYLYNVFLEQAVVDKIKEFLLSLFTRPWKKLNQIDNIYTKLIFLNFPEPPSVSTYMNVLKTEHESEFDQDKLDKIFGAQRLTGTNPAMIRGVKTQEDVDYVKQKLQMPEGAEKSLDDLLKKRMENNTLDEAMARGRLYMVDYTDILADLPCKTGVIAAPIALFFVNEKDDLMPVAIQLFRKLNPESLGQDNPIFTPDDDSYTWLLAKMWFNNADASFHESSSHLGFTHLIMETVYIALQRTVSISHPLYRLMAPHFRYLMNVNSVAWDLLLNKTGWVNTSMNIGVVGMLEIIRRKFEGIPEPQQECHSENDGVNYLVQPWRLDVEGNIEKDIENRKVEDLPKYQFREDALAVHMIIKEYVENKVNEVYECKEDDPQRLHKDYEIQAWGKMLYDPAKPDDPANSGCGIKGLTFACDDTDGPKIYFRTKHQLIETITSVIYTCSAAHAAVNFRQYDNYGFPLNYPALLHGDPPRSKGGHGPDNEMVQRTADDILQALPTKQETLGTMTITDILSNKNTVNKDDKNKLGYFPIQYQFTSEPGDIPKNVQNFKKKLDDLSGTIGDRNKRLGKERRSEEAYDVLDPKHIPNSISL